MDRIMKMNGFMLRRNIFYNVLYIAVGFCFSVVSTGFIRLTFLLLKLVYPRHVHSRNHKDGYGLR